MRQLKQLAQKRFPAHAYQLKAIRQLVTDAVNKVGRTKEELNLIVVAVNEACTNVIQHAYKNDPNGELIVEILSDGLKMLFRITDFAERMDPNNIPARDLDIVRPGGLGVPLIHAVMDEINHFHPHDKRGNILELTKYFN